MFIVMFICLVKFNSANIVFDVIVKYIICSIPL